MRNRIALSLTLKVPPLLLAAIFATLIWLVASATPDLMLPSFPKGIAVFIPAIGGLVLIVSAVRSFRKTKTTLSPLSPGSASSLATGGVYGLTRNPMYLGLLLLLVAWALFLENVFSLALSFGFVLWMNHFQIIPEERALESVFGQEYLAYKGRVRRWL